MDWEALEADLQEFERQEFGTNDPDEIREMIEAREWDAARARMTGMDEEQRDWEGGE